MQNINEISLKIRILFATISIFWWNLVNSKKDIRVHDTDLCYVLEVVREAFNLLETQV